MRDIDKERLDLEKESIIRNREDVEEAKKYRDMFVGKGEQLQKDVMELFGVKEEVGNIELLGDDKE